MADLWWVDRVHGGGQRPPELEGLESLERPSALWPSLYLAVARACADGEPMRADSWAQPFQRVAQDSWEGALLAATPALLLQANRYGHGLAMVRGWVNDLRLSSPVRLALESYYQLLCRALADQTGRRIISQGQWGLGSDRVQGIDAKLSSLQTYPLGSLQELVQTAQGQFLLTLELAQAQGWPASAISLVGVLAILTTGPVGLPRYFYHRYLAALPRSARWPHCEARQLEQLADALYYRWAGVRHTAMPKLGTAYNG